MDNAVMHGVKLDTRMDETHVKKRRAEYERNVKT